MGVNKNVKSKVAKRGAKKSNGLGNIPTSRLKSSIRPVKTKTQPYSTTGVPRRKLKKR